MEPVDGLGYRLTDIENELTAEEFERFCIWFTGQTGVVSRRGEWLVYCSDWEKFLNWHERQWGE